MNYGDIVSTGEAVGIKVDSIVGIGVSVGFGLGELVGIGIGCDTGLFQVGLIGMQTNENGFQKMSKHKGRWDYYYFKYIHVPDDVEGCINEISILDKMGILDSKNEVTFEDFIVMAKLKTLTPIKKLKEYL